MASAEPRRPPRRSRARAWLPSGFVLYLLIASLAIAGIVVWDRTHEQPQLDPFGRPIRAPVTDPAVRARNAVQGLHLGVRITESRFDQGTGTLVIGWTSKYYDPKRDKGYNREYLKTEGTLALQLIFSDATPVRRIVATMYQPVFVGRAPLARVEGARDEQYGQYQVAYFGPLQ